MTVLIVDDQMTVLKGILNGVDFSGLGIQTVLTATGTIEAKELIEKNKIDILLSDVEMPGENGILLLKWVTEHHPDIVRILLTSHADFTYARESIKLGCYDYIVQPAPYQEIEASLARAVNKINLDREKEKYYQEGMIYARHKPELNDRTILNLYSRIKMNQEQSIDLLNQMGYPLSADSSCQLIFTEIYPMATSTDSAFFDLSLRLQLLNSLKAAHIECPVYSLLTLNPFKQFVTLLFCNDDALLHYEPSVFQSYFKEVTGRICPEIAVYIGNTLKFADVRPELLRIDSFIQNNVNKNPGLYFTNQDKPSETLLGIADNIPRWSRLLNSQQFSQLEDGVLAYIDFISAVNKTNLKTLCDFHQQLTQMFFIYAYQHDIDVTELFSKEYPYHEYMDGFKNTKALRDAVRYIIPALAAASGGDDKKNDVQIAKDFILNNISRNLSVKDVADYVHLSPEYFTKLFKKEVGQNIKNYILQVKVDVAKDLLGNPNIPISVVALDLGYSNFSHFTQMFKKFEDVTPTEYRKNLLEKNKL